MQQLRKQTYQSLIYHPSMENQTHSCLSLSVGIKLSRFRHKTVDTRITYNSEQEIITTHIMVMSITD